MYTLLYVHMELWQWSRFRRVRSSFTNYLVAVLVLDNRNESCENRYYGVSLVKGQESS